MHIFPGGSQRALRRDGGGRAEEVESPLARRDDGRAHRGPPRRGQERGGASSLLLLELSLSLYPSRNAAAPVHIEEIRFHQAF